MPAWRRRRVGTGSCIRTKADDGGKIARDLAGRCVFLAGGAGSGFNSSSPSLGAAVAVRDGGRAAERRDVELGRRDLLERLRLVFLLLTCALSFYYNPEGRRGSPPNRGALSGWERGVRPSGIFAAGHEIRPSGRPVVLRGG